MNKYKNIEKIQSCIDRDCQVYIDQKIYFNVKDLEDESYSNYEYVGETIENKSKDILKKYNYELKYRNFYAYLMREIMRNVVEHSMAKDFMLDLYINNNELGFRVVDNGIGIKKSLEKNPSYLLKDNMTALAFAIRPGITRSYHNDPLRSDEWQNSGFGLYMVSNIINKINGRFEIATGNIRLIYEKNRLNYIRSSIDNVKRGGTEVLCVFNTNQKINTMETIKEISQKGNDYTRGTERFAEFSTIKTASKASTLIE